MEVKVSSVIIIIYTNYSSRKLDLNYHVTSIIFYFSFQALRKWNNVLIKLIVFEMLLCHIKDIKAFSVTDRGKSASLYFRHAITLRYVLYL